MKRTGRYELVWSKPMTKLCAELGISEVGQAKACRRHAIPVTPLGHCAKLQAGKTAVQLPPPQPGTDMEVWLTTVTPAQRQAGVAQKQRPRRWSRKRRKRCVAWRRPANSLTLDLTR
jgi:hypothetical protein